MTGKKKKSNRAEKAAWLVLICSGTALIVYAKLYHKWEERHEKKSATLAYHAFGIVVPPHYGIHGIDVSSYQGSVHWPSVRAVEEAGMKMGFAFIKATEGLNDTDKKFVQNWQKAKASGMIRGAYHFFLATKSGKEQAEQFIKQVTLQKNDLPPVLDIEKRYGVPPAMMRQRVKEWLDLIETHYGVKPIIYTYPDFYERHLGKAFDNYPLWVAHYFEPERPRIGRRWHFWQYSETGKVNGIRLKVDCNVFNGDSSDFKQLLLK